MSILNKLKVKKEFSPKERTEAAAAELKQVMDKYHCIVDVQHQLTIIPLEIKNEVVNTEKKNK